MTIMRVQPWRDYIKNNRIVWNQEDAGENAFLNTFMFNAQTFFDVGVAEESHIVTELYSKDRGFHLFEPNPKLHSLLGEKYASYKNIYINNVGLGACTESIEYFENSTSFINRSNAPSNPNLFQTTPGEILNVMALDEYCAEHNVQEIDFLKIDVEGFELAVIQGAKNMLASGIKCVQFEYGGTYHDANITLQQVTSEPIWADWKLYMLQPTTLIHINKSDVSKFETFQYGNFIMNKGEW